MAYGMRIRDGSSDVCSSERLPLSAERKAMLESGKPTYMSAVPTMIQLVSVHSEISSNGVAGCAKKMGGTDQISPCTNRATPSRRMETGRASCRDKGGLYEES